MSTTTTALRSRIAFILILASFLCACSSHPSKHQPGYDPYESYNRAMFHFNKVFDGYVWRPMAQGYRAVTPAFVERGVGNMFSNVGDIPIVINDLLQLELEQAVRDTGRFAINTTAGVLGWFDVATGAGIEKNVSDFGTTLGRWGYKRSNYVVFPFFGPSTMRDSIGLVVDLWVLDPLMTVKPHSLRYSLYGLELTDYRADLLDKEDILSAAAFDEYTFIRDAYMQNRLLRIDPQFHRFVDCEDEFDDGFGEGCDF